MFKEFKDFIMTGNVIDLAVAVILAGAVGAVVNSFVADIAMPLVGFLTGGVDFSDMKYVLGAAVTDAAGEVTTPEVAIMYGKWITSIISLIMVGLVLFVIVKAYNASKEKEVEAEPAGPTELDLLAEIRDALKK
ncbi:MAG: large conductance mechanosensitive channel protein MscL [Spirosomaceae bacterium]|nr:large conductance mechanosensitive channel protein MscL [Spirosomataceae bacterium]